MYKTIIIEVVILTTPYPLEVWGLNLDYCGLGHVSSDWDSWVGCLDASDRIPAGSCFQHANSRGWAVYHSITLRP